MNKIKIYYSPKYDIIIEIGYTKKKFLYYAYSDVSALKHPGTIYLFEIANEEHSIFLGYL